jgi:DnaJ-class molecular chaperone
MTSLKPWEEICPDCRGKGIVEELSLVGEEGMKLETDGYFHCWVCNGSGKVIKEGHEMYAITTININQK